MAYFLIIKLFEKLRVEKNYNKNLTGVIEHIWKFWKLLKFQENEIFVNLTEKGIVPEMFLTEWFVTFGTSFIPLSYHIKLYRELLEKGWPYFYTMIVFFLKKLYPKFKGLSFPETILIIKSNKNCQVIDWREIFGYGRWAIN